MALKVDVCTVKRARVQRVRKVKGLDGAKGDSGTRGVQGAKGLQGIRGLSGSRGEIGIGRKGDKGLQGTKGGSGPQGEKGDRGFRGEPGIGLQGNKGSAGPAGVKGETGPQGPVPDHQINLKDGKIRFMRPDGKWGAWLVIKREIIDRTITVQSGGRGAQVTQALSDIDRLMVIFSVVTKTEDYTAGPGDYTIVADGSDNTVTIQLLPDPHKGRTYNVACLNSDNQVDIDFNGKNFYDSADNELLFKGENLKIQYDGTQWVGG